MERLAEASEDISLQVEGDNFTIESGGRLRTLLANGETKQRQGERGSIESKQQLSHNRGRSGPAATSAAPEDALERYSRFDFTTQLTGAKILGHLL